MGCNHPEEKAVSHLHEDHPFAARVLPPLGRPTAVHQGVHVAVPVRLGEYRERVIRVERQGRVGILEMAGQVSAEDCEK